MRGQLFLLNKNANLEGPAYLISLNLKEITATVSSITGGCLK